MQFQRLQQLLIIVAIIAMFIFCFAPCGKILVPEGVTGVKVDVMPSEFLGIMLPAVMAGIMLLISLLVFKALKFQYQLVFISLLFTVCAMGLTIFTLFKGLNGYDATFTPWDVTLIVAALCEIWAMGRIRHDRHLLASYNRIR